MPSAEECSHVLSGGPLRPEKKEKEKTDLGALKVTDCDQLQGLCKVCNNLTWFLELLFFCSICFVFGY